MAIPMKRYVSIQSGTDSSVVGSRALGGLVFCTENMKSSADASIKSTYNAGTPIKMSMESIASLFDDDTDVYKFAQKYFSYISPSGTTPDGLTVVKMQNAEDPDEALARVDGLTNDFGSFTFLGVTVSFAPSAWSATHAYVVGDVVTNSGSSYYCISAHTSSAAFATDSAKWMRVSATYTASKLAEVAEQNAGYNYRYLFCISFDAVHPTTLATAIGSYNGTAYVIGDDPICGSYMLMAVAAATDYDATNSTTVFMYKQFSGETATIYSETTADSMDAKYINYYGRTQTNGKTIDFLQRGFMSNGDDIACYCNEIWLKSRIATDIINLLTSIEKIPANEDGAAMIFGICSAAATDAITNGTILVGKPLDQGQIFQILQLTNDPKAVDRINEQGYWLNVVIVKDGNEYKAKYRLVYSKGDAIRKVEGTHNLI